MLEIWRSLRVGAWLGWQNESNWADPWLFFIYTLAKPMAGALILVVMYRVVAQTDTTDPLFAYLYLGNAFYTYLGALAVGLAWSIQEDREFFRIVKCVAIAPVRYLWYTVGRAAARAVMATVSAAVLVAFGVLVLRIAVRWEGIRWGLFVPGFFLGLVACVAVGLFLAGVLLVTPRKGFNAIDAVSGLIYLLAGVVFPLDVLPAWVQPVSRVLPFTYWLEAIRRGLVGGGLNRSLAALADAQIMARLLLLTGLYLPLSVLWFNWCRQRARALGLIDAATEW